MQTQQPRTLHKGFIQLQKNILYDKRLTCTQKLVYAHMQDQHKFFISQGKQYFESMESICELLNLSRKTVQTAINELQEVGLIEKNTIRKGKSFNNTYRILDSAQQKEGPEGEPF